MTLLGCLVLFPHWSCPSWPSRVCFGDSQRQHRCLLSRDFQHLSFRDSPQSLANAYSLTTEHSSPTSQCGEVDYPSLKQKKCFKVTNVEGAV